MALDLELFNITLPDGRTAFGAEQGWFPDRRKRMSGCGCVAAANIILYYSRAFPGVMPGSLYEALKKKIVGTADVLPLMEEMWNYFTPGFMGLHTTAAFEKGAAEYSKSRGLSLSTAVIDVPAGKKNRPAPDAVKAFLEKAFGDGCPVAFLNLSSGGVKNLQSWHWVTVVSVEESSGGLTVTASDEGRKITLDLFKWLKRSRLGGGFVVIKCCARR